MKNLSRFILEMQNSSEPTIQDVYRMGRRYAQMFQQYFTDPNLYDLFSSKCLEFANLFSNKTGAAGKHHNFLGGLAVHTFEMLDILYNTYVKHPQNAKKFNTLKNKDNENYDWQVCATAILYHDWGKLKEYKHNQGPDENGRWEITYAMMMQGHIFMSAEQFDSDADKFGVDKDLKFKIAHAILAHHSKREWGSPVTPITPEARIVCACDLISAERAKGKTDYFNQFMRGELNYDDYEDFYMTTVMPRLNKQQLKYKKFNKGEKIEPDEKCLIKPVNITGWENDVIMGFLNGDKTAWITNSGEIPTDANDRYAIIESKR